MLSFQSFFWFYFVLWKKGSVEFHATVFHCSQIPALSKAFPSYVIPPYRAVSFVVVRHHRLADDYWAAISYQVGFIAHSKFGGVYFVGTDDAFRG